jgi:type IV pilus assembly protein PilY1
MQELAAVGQGKYYKSDTVDALIKAISQTVDDAIELSGTISAAGVAVNQLSRLTHLNQLYYSVFEPKPQSYRWDGNLKRYKLGPSASAILDANNNVATDDATGFFKDNAQSFWSTSTDGKSAVLGGAASVLPSPDDRKMFTYMGSLNAKKVALTPINLNDSAFNTAAKAATGISDDSTYKNLMNWYRGYDISSLYDGLETPSAERKQIGAALHSQPVLVNYGYSGTLADASNADSQKNYVFFSTLEGTLHAIEAKTGKEKFSFIPGEKLSTLKTRYDNPVAVNPEFGLDLTWTIFRNDADFSGQINSGDKLYIYGGMRMGGSNYYALDVTNLNSPSLLFAIQGGVDKYKNMGQTWSQPVLANVKVGGAKRTVIVFGGGYDPRHETANQIFTGNDKGNQLYIVDAFTGELIWFASGNSTDGANSYVANMKFSVPSSPEVLDMTGDGIADAIYFGDLGGQVFRVDLNGKASTGADLGKRVHLLAKVGQTESATTANQRRFYEPPAVAVFKDSAGTRFATVAIGSGYRSRPLNLVTDDRYLVLFDKDVTRLDIATADDSTLQGLITTADLAELDMTSSAVQTNGVDVTNKKGWYVDLPESGEKSFSQGVIFKAQLLFTTYSPSLSGSSNCSPVTGQTNLYKFCMPYGKLCDGDSYVTQSVTLGLSGDPQLIVSDYDDNGIKKYKVTPLIGTQLGNDLDTGDGKVSLEPTKKWREKTINE